MLFLVVMITMILRAAVGEILPRFDKKFVLSLSLKKTAYKVSAMNTVNFAYKAT